jgi:tetratricopeptide (TPR) repeat protein
VSVSDDVAAIYNILYRYLFDRHRDLTLPTSFLIDAQGDIVKVYQGPVDPRVVEEDFKRIPQTTEQRLAKALPFPGNAETYEFGRNNLSLGSAFFQRGYYDQAAASFQIALRDDPSSAEAQYGLGSVYLKQEKNAERGPAFEQAVNSRRTIPTPSQTRGTISAFSPRARGAPTKPSDIFKKLSASAPIIGSRSRTWATRIGSRSAGTKRARRLGASSRRAPSRAGSELQPGHGLCANRRHRARLSIFAKCFEIAPRLSGGVEQPRSSVSANAPQG